MPSLSHSAAGLALTCALLGTVASPVRAQGPTLADRIVASVEANIPDWAFDAEASRLRGSPLSIAEQTPDRTVIWIRTLVWDWHDGRASVDCVVYPSLREAEIAVRNLRDSLPVGTRPVADVDYDATSAATSLQVRRGRVVAQINARDREVRFQISVVSSAGRQLADLIVSEVERDPELLRDSLTAVYRHTC
jgi:hypothetical protein